MDTWYANRWKETCMFYTDNDKGVVVDTNRLLHDLYEELENY